MTQTNVTCYMYTYSAAEEILVPVRPNTLLMPKLATCTKVELNLYLCMQSFMPTYWYRFFLEPRGREVEHTWRKSNWAWQTVALRTKWSLCGATKKNEVDGPTDGRTNFVQEATYAMVPSAFIDRGLKRSKFNGAQDVIPKYWMK